MKLLAISECHAKNAQLELEALGIEVERHGKTLNFNTYGLTDEQLEAIKTRAVGVYV